MSAGKPFKKPLRKAKNFLRSLVGLPPRRDEWYVDFIIRRGNSLQFQYNDGHQSRQEATMHLLLEAIKTIKYEARQNRRLTFYTSDRPPADQSRPVLSYSAIRGSKNIIAVPDFSFWNWPEVGINDYSQLTAEMIAAGMRPASDQRLFWVGNTGTSPVRERLMEIAAGDQRIYASDITWEKQEGPERWASEQLMGTQEAKYVSLPDHCDYKYLIDIEGIGYSGRLKILLFSQRPVFIQDRPWREFYFDWMEPFHHYIPVAHDLSDLSKQLDWAESHPEECRKIAANALAFAQRHLTREMAILHLRKEISKLLA